jgi:segregation and condensation protein B
MTPDLPALIESLLFAAEEPLRLETLRGVLDAVEPAAIREALESLAAEYEARGGGFYLQEVAGGYQLRTRPCFHPWIRRLKGGGSERLSRAALETLAIVAYRQPIMRVEIETLRGVDCGGVLRLLLERRLIRVMGRKEIPGRPLIYGTTRQFLEAFELRDLKDLPTLREILELAPETPGTDRPPKAPQDGKNP